MNDYSIDLYEYKGNYAKVEITDGKNIIETKRYLWSTSDKKYFEVPENDSGFDWIIGVYEKGIRTAHLLMQLDTFIENGKGKIYLTENKNNNKKYVGLTTVGVLRRFNQHCKAESYLGNAIRKHGKESFEVNIIDAADTYLELAQKRTKVDSFL